MVKLLSEISRDWSLRSLAQITLIRFFNAKFLFQKVNRFLKEERGFFINLVLFPWRSETTQKTSLWIEKYQKCLLLQIAKKLSQITFSFALILQITTNCCYKLGQSSYTLRQVVLQITTEHHR